MPIALQNGRAVVKNGGVSCTCCDEGQGEASDCSLPSPWNHPSVQITNEEFANIRAGGIIRANIWSDGASETNYTTGDVTLSCDMSYSLEYIVTHAYGPIGTSNSDGTSVCRIRFGRVNFDPGANIEGSENISGFITDQNGDQIELSGPPATIYVATNLTYSLDVYIYLLNGVPYLSIAGSLRLSVRRYPFFPPSFQCSGWCLTNLESYPFVPELYDSRNVPVTINGGAERTLVWKHKGLDLDGENIANLISNSDLWMSVEFNPPQAP